MFDWIAAFFKNLHHSGLKVSHIVAYFIIGVTILICLNDITRFTYTYRTNNKVEILNKYEKLLGDTTLSADDKLKIRQQRNELINDKSKLAELPIIIVNSIKSNTDGNKTKQVHTENKNTDNPKVIVKKPKRNLFWHVLTSNLLLCVLLIIMPIIILAYEKKIEMLHIALIIFFEILIGLMIALMSYLTSFIPIFDNVIWNYVLNIVVTVPIWTLIIFVFGNTNTNNNVVNNFPNSTISNLK